MWILGCISLDCSEQVPNIPYALGQWSGLELFGQTIWWIRLLFLSAQLEMDDDDDEMKLEESVVNVAIVAAWRFINKIDVQTEQ